MDDIAEYDEEISKPLAPSHNDLKSSIQPELLKRFSSKVIIMEPMSKRDYIEMIPRFAEVLPAACRGLFSKLAREQAAQAHKDMISMRFFQEVLTQTLTADVASPVPPERPKPNPIG